MMGFAFTNPDTPVTKGTSGLTVMNRDEVVAGEETTLRALRQVRGRVPHASGPH
jgi:Na+-translocating ferredoxin:NAD+ oxidoreductase RnfC subunit